MSTDPICCHLSKTSNASFTLMDLNFPMCILANYHNIERSNINNNARGWAWCLTPVIPAPWEAKAGR